MVRSVDGGKTFSDALLLGDDFCWNIDGTVWVTYTHDRETIGWVHFNERWLADGGGAAQIACIEGDEMCVAGACYRTCSADGDCGGGMICRGNACRRGCSTDGDCCGRGRCDGGLCASTEAIACLPG